MKARNTILLLLIAVGFYFYLRYYESRQPTTQEARELSGHVLQFDRSKVDGINLETNDTKIELRRRDNEWQMDAPIKDKADDTVVEQLLNAVEGLEKESSIKPEPGKDEGRDLGLVKPNVSLQLLGQDAPPAILFGKDTAIEGKGYIRLSNSDEIYVVANDLRSQVTRPADDYRDHQLADVAATQVTQVNIKTSAGEIELQKSQDHWQINRPIKARGDDGKIADLISQTLTVKVDSFVPGNQAGVANAALNDAQGTVTFGIEGADKPLVLQISKPLDSQKVYAKLSTRDAVVLLPRAVAGFLSISPSDVRDHHLVRINLDTVDRIHVTPAGAPDIVLARKGEDWTIKSMGDKPANGGDVQKMAAVLQSQPVTAFVSDVATDLQKYGLDQPHLKVTFSSYATDNTAETKAGEQPLETILFGDFAGPNVYAKLDDEPFIVSVPRNVLEGIYTDPLKWQELAIYNLKAADITGLEVTRDDQAMISMMNDKGQWKPAKGDIALNTVNIESMVNTLSTLRAVEWAGETKPYHGLGKPAATITFTTQDKMRRTVTVGASANADYWYASATGFDGTFLINKPDHDALVAEVLPVLMPSASPPAAAVPLPGVTPGVTTSLPAPPGPVQVSTSPVEAK
jgi:hypothetical protein